MNCRNCGAALQPVSERTAFHCPYCGAFDFPAGNEDGVTVIGEATNHSCPVCAEELKSATIIGHTVEYCEKCHGILTTNTEFAAILARRREMITEKASAVQPFTKDEFRRRLSCPNCKKLMDTYPYGGGGHAIVDSCYPCNLIWLDAGEMDVLARHRPKCASQ
jgi:Zn-finger nucleic acid-binding protein